MEGTTIPASDETASRPAALWNGLPAERIDVTPNRISGWSMPPVHRRCQPPPERRIHGGLPRPTVTSPLREADSDCDQCRGPQRKLRVWLACGADAPPLPPAPPGSSEQPRTPARSLTETHINGRMAIATLAVVQTLPKGPLINLGDARADPARLMSVFVVTAIGVEGAIQTAPTVHRKMP